MLRKVLLAFLSFSACSVSNTKQNCRNPSFIIESPSARENYQSKILLHEVHELVLERSGFYYKKITNNPCTFLGQSYFGLKLKPTISNDSLQIEHCRLRPCEKSFGIFSLDAVNNQYLLILRFFWTTSQPMEATKYHTISNNYFLWWDINQKKSWWQISCQFYPMISKLKMGQIIKCSFFALQFIILRHILRNMKAKSSSRKGAFFYPMFANWARVNEPAAVVHVSECQKFFSSNCSKNDVGSREFFCRHWKECQKNQKKNK